MFLRWLLLTLFTSGVPAQALTAYHCACQFSASCGAGYRDEADLLNRAASSDASAIVELGQEIAEVSGLLSSLPDSPQHDTLVWRLAPLLVDLHELMEAEQVFTISEIEAMSKESLQKTQALRDALLPLLPARADSPVAPSMPNSEALPLPEVTSPKAFIYVTPRLSDFEKWFAALSAPYQKAVRKRLVSISRDLYFGDTETTTESQIFELRFIKSAAPRIYFSRHAGAIFIVGFGIKSTNIDAQYADIVKARRVNELYLRSLH